MNLLFPPPLKSFSHLPLNPCMPHFLFTVHFTLHLLIDSVFQLSTSKINIVKITLKSLFFFMISWRLQKFKSSGRDNAVFIQNYCSYFPSNASKCSAKLVTKKSPPIVRCFNYNKRPFLLKTEVFWIKMSDNYIRRTNSVIRCLRQV